MPIRTVVDLFAAARALSPHDWPLLRYLRWTLDDALSWASLRHDARLRAFMAMVVQDTVHSDPSVAPLVNSCLGLSIRGAIARPYGGMFGFWRAFESRAVGDQWRMPAGSKLDERQPSSSASPRRMPSGPRT